MTILAESFKIMNQPDHVGMQRVILYPLVDFPLCLYPLVDFPLCPRVERAGRVRVTFKTCFQISASFVVIIYLEKYFLFLFFFRPWLRKKTRLDFSGLENVTSASRHSGTQYGLLLNSSIPQCSDVWRVSGIPQLGYHGAARKSLEQLYA